MIADNETGRVKAVENNLKNKGMIAVLCLILVLGIVTTAATRRYILGQAGNDKSLAAGTEAGAVYEAEPFAAAQGPENGLAGEVPAADGETAGTEKAAEETEAPEESETAWAETGAPDMDAGIEKSEAASRKAAAETEPVDAEEGVRVQAEGDLPAQFPDNSRGKKRSDSQVAGKTAEKQTSDNAVDRSAVASPVENGIVSPAGGASSGAGANSDRTAKDYRERLSEIEDTIQNLQNSGSANTTDAMREAAAYEYRLWDAELNQIYQAIMAVLPDEEADTLRGRERRWIRKRDTAAKQAAERYKGGTMESVEYTASLADSTRERAYELLDLYESYLPAES